MERPSEGLPLAQQQRRESVKRQALMALQLGVPGLESSLVARRRTPRHGRGPQSECKTGHLVQAGKTSGRARTVVRSYSISALHSMLS